MLVMLALLLPLAGSWAASADTLVLKTNTGEHSYDVEVARTDRERALGLMFRRTMPKTNGMLFVYEPPQGVVMWMRNTYIPLDMIFIDGQGRVHRIETNTEPFSTDIIPSEGVVAGVLELNAGEAAKIGLKPGDRVIYPGFASGAGGEGR